MTQTLRIGVLGCGMISADHFAAWSRCQGAKVVAVCDPMLDRAQARAREFGVPSAYSSPEAMIAAETLDAVDIITPRQTHADMIRLAARHGLSRAVREAACARRSTKRRRWWRRSAPPSA